ncbi:hypothetical protein L484_001009 [Morus notabilis]|uniref:Inhibitor I9 domain-containing protein n=1 Tax=Morus notabilis TaxID=981085 RepID=W9S5U9_9ROSA|nr:hypothetical protein L484_001009 [Morus notabilis]
MDINHSDLCNMYERQTNVTQTFIIRLQNSLKPSEYSNVVDWYSSTLRSLSTLRAPNYDDNMMVHVYNTVFQGFSAKLSGEQA